MNKITESKVVKVGSVFFAVLAALLLSSGDASAKEHKAKEGKNKNYVVAHIPFTGLSELDMSMQRKPNGSYYLYIQHSQEQGVSIIDISKPVHPKSLGVIPWPDQEGGTVNLMGDFAIVSQSKVRSTRSDTAN
jgi:hypothetical protein